MSRPAPEGSDRPQSAPRSDQHAIVPPPRAAAAAPDRAAEETVVGRRLRVLQDHCELLMLDRRYPADDAPLADDPAMSPPPLGELSAAVQALLGALAE